MNGSAANTNDHIQKPSPAYKESATSEHIEPALPKEEVALTDLRSGVIECIENDLGSSSWEALLDVERAQTAQELKQELENIVKAYKKAFSQSSKRTLNGIYKKLKSRG